jgi:uncharacterized protein (TIGR03000 family)
MMSRQVAALFAASLLGMGMSGAALGQSEYENQPPGRPGGEFAPSYYFPSAPFYAPSHYVQPTGTRDTGFVSAEVMNNGTALLRVHLPTDAKLFFGKTAATGQGGSMRLFRSPSLDPSSNYQYDLRAQWTENGRTVERTRTVPIHANDVVNVDFTHGG